MFLITNRCIDETLKTVEAFGDTFNAKGPPETPERPRARACVLRAWLQQCRRSA